MHSDTYLGEDYISPNLVHWKYIKKERKNGRWVYYYDESGDKTLNNLKSSVQDRFDEREQHKYITQDLVDYKKNKNKKNYNGVFKNEKGKIDLGANEFTYKNGKETSEKVVRYKNVDEGIRDQTKKYNKKNKEYNDAKKAYNSYNNSFKVKSRRIIGKIATKTLNQVSNSVYKAKKFLKSIFG
jgi:hypothetical protein